jgi:hypothetical protein
MKNAAKAFAPSGVCWVASSGITGGFSPGLVFGPVRGTSAGTVGCEMCGGPGAVDPTDVLGAGVETVRDTEPGAATDDEGESPAEDVHAATPRAITNAANVQIQRTLA